MVSLEVFAGIVVVAAAGAGAVGWMLRRIGEDARRRAYEAAFGEQVNAAGCARDRAREEGEQVEQRFQRLKAEHLRCPEEIGRLEQALARRESEVVSLRLSIEAGEERLAELEVQTQSSLGKLGSLATKLDALSKLKTELNAERQAHAGCAGAERKLKLRLDELESRLEVTSRQRHDDAPNWLLSGPQGSKDDLKAIRGLGPVIERDLNKLGVFHFHQLARMTEKDVHWIAGRIHSFTGLNTRYAWAKQARGIAGNGHGRETSG
jgi:predicted flap endonuclease-1-like 5' DNA nuclease